MEPISPDTDKLEVQVGRTPKGYDLVIVPTKNGLYRVESRGPGPTSYFENELYTTLSLARRAVDNYRRANATEYAKQAALAKSRALPSIKERRKAEALALKNGAVEVPDEDSE